MSVDWYCSIWWMVAFSKLLTLFIKYFKSSQMPGIFLVASLKWTRNMMFVPLSPSCTEIYQLSRRNSKLKFEELTYWDTVNYFLPMELDQWSWTKDTCVSSRFICCCCKYGCCSWIVCKPEIATAKYRKCFTKLTSALELHRELKGK